MSELSDLIKMLRNKKESGSDYIGIVSRVDGGTAYVQIAGSDIMDTPVALTVDCKPGDRVRIRVNSGKAWITGNDTAPPTNDTKNIQKIQNDLYGSDGKVSTVTKIVERIGQLAANTNQFFWRTEKGTDTGVHITEVPREKFLKDPENGGGNLLARSNGIAVRDGLTELASMTTEGVKLGRSDGFQTIVNEDSIEMINDSGGTGFRISLDGNSTQRTVANTYTLHTSQKPTVTFSAPIESYTLTFRANINGTAYTATKTDSNFTIGDSFYLGVSNVGRIRVSRTDSSSFKATAISGGTAMAMSLIVSYVTSTEMAKMNFTGGNNVLWSGSGSYMGSNQSVNLDENVSEQLNGICLVWSAYSSGAAQNYEWFYQFIPKDTILHNNGGAISSGIMTSASYMGMKIVYVNDSAISGHANNATTMTVAGISFTNNHWVLRYVLGV